MHKYMIVLMTSLAAAAVVAGDAWAAKRPLTYMSSGQLKKACGKTGGSFAQNGGFYGCYKKCKSSSGKNATCSTFCNSYEKKCEETTPGRTAGGTMEQILRGGTYSDRRNVKTLINNAGDFAQQPTGTRMINSSGTFQAGRPAAVGVPTTGVPNLAMPGRPAPSQGTLNMQKR
jgi:hypothetical protein